MRRITTLENRELAHRLSALLYHANIPHHLEERMVEHKQRMEIWIIEEDDLQKATELTEAFLKNPEDPAYRAPPIPPKKVPTPPPLAPEEREKLSPLPRRRSGLFGGAPLGWATLVLLGAAVLCFLFGGIRLFQDAGDQEETSLVALSPLYRTLLYDYPTTFARIDAFLAAYPPAEYPDVESLPPAGKQELEIALHTPYWKGLYGWVVATLKGSADRAEGEGPLYEKVREGEIWRLWTPCILHANLLHIFFNALWLLLLGNQIEWRLGMWRYLLFLLIAGLLTNACQYFMSGPLFLGLSGIITTFLGFIWIRQRRAPWEGYLLSRMTIWFIMLFIFGIFLLQLISFGLELAGKEAFAPPVANTAHISGVVLGLLLGRFNLFAAQS